jgi:hypothetical protein
MDEIWFWEGKSALWVGSGVPLKVSNCGLGLSPVMSSLLCQHADVQVAGGPTHTRRGFISQVE